MENRDKKIRIKKVDALYIYYNPVNCGLVYFALCFTTIRICHDLMREPVTLFKGYLVPLFFAGVLGIGMYRWAVKTFRTLGLGSVV